MLHSASPSPGPSQAHSAQPARPFCAQSLHCSKPVSPVRRCAAASSGEKPCFINLPAIAGPRSLVLPLLYVFVLILLSALSSAAFLIFGGGGNSLSGGNSQSSWVCCGGSPLR